ncbi:MAG: M14 family metallocarboxypeptidase [Kangiellaceae bacterium]|jgi:hypothetical protein|nr:M14 family metallocarboxypeptidase [Kangiellaceae bacterium]
MSEYPIGTLGQPWGEAERKQWFEMQSIKRSYQEEVVSKIHLMSQQFTIRRYGALSIDETSYPLFALLTQNWQDDKPTVLITGGVHGYETSGVHGALMFAEQAEQRFNHAFNFIIAPCLSPWGYETINRWNPNAEDPNRSFAINSGVEEAVKLMLFIKELNVELLAHFDLHETTDTDNSEFRPALAARDAIEQKTWNIPDGFYCVDDSNTAKHDFQTAIINSVRRVTHIAAADDNGCLIGEPITQEGVINYDKKSLNLCGGFSGANYVTTTEVYPDSPKVDANNCNQAQVAAIIGGLNYLLAD